MSLVQEPVPMKKICSICKEEKNYSDFSKRSDRGGVPTPECKICRRARDSKTYKNNPEYAKEYNATLKGRYSKYKTTAKSFNREFNISLEEFSSFWDKPCYYCKDPISGIGLDRVNSDVGYILENIVSCCYTCNRMKMNLSNDFWFAHMKKIIGDKE